MIQNKKGNFDIIFQILNSSKNNFYTDEKEYLNTKTKYKITKSILKETDIGQAYLADFYTDLFYISTQKDVAITQIGKDAQWLLDYMSKSGKLNRLGLWANGLLKPYSLKKRLYIVRNITLDGHPCSSKESLELLVRQCDIIQQIDSIAVIWNVEAMEFSSLVTKYKFLREIIKTAKELMDLLEKGDEALQQLISEEGLLLS